MTKQAPHGFPLLPLLDAGIPAVLLKLLQQEGVPTEPLTVGEARGTFVLFDSRRNRFPSGLTTGQIAIDVAAVCASEPALVWLEKHPGRSIRKLWQVGPWQAGEEVAVVDRRQLRERVVSELRAAIEAAGGVWMRTAAYPAPYQTAANFRFDHDAYVASDFDAVLEAIAGYEAMTSHFVCASTHEAYPETLARLRGLDVGSHGFRHHTYRTRRENVTNIAFGIARLVHHGLNPGGFAAPLGRYNADLAAAVAELGISHTSEFAAAYDDLPFFAAVGDVVQLPIHPVCLGIVLEAAVAADDSELGRRAAEATAEHFIAVASEKHAAGLPIFLYGHPDGRLGRHPEILRRTLAAIDSLPQVWKVTLSEFQRWWRARAAAKWQLYRTTAGYEIRSVVTSPGYATAIEWTTTAGKAKFALSESGRTTIPIRPEFAPHMGVDRALPVGECPSRGVRSSLKRYLDWEFETPLDEIDTHEWRGWMKRTLRQIRRRPPRTTGAAR